MSVAPPDIFISYAREDVEWVRPLAAELERRGWQVFWDQRIPAGKSWRSHIGVRLEAARCIIVVWSGHALTSKFVLQEADVGLEREVLMPVLRQSIRPPLGFREVHAANLAEWRPGEPSSEFTTFIADLGEMLAWSPVASVEVAPDAPTQAPEPQRLIAGPTPESLEPAAPLQLVPPPALPPSTGNDRVGLVIALGIAAAPSIGVVIYVMGTSPPATHPTPPPELKAEVVTPAPPVVDAKPSKRPGTVFTDTLRDGSPCAFCPEMVVIPAGSFTMGSPGTEEGRYADEGPQRQVAFEQPFALGRHEITFAEWDACAAAGECDGYRPDDLGWGRGSRPVINVSWHDAQTFVAWLSDRTGESYRLPSEAEWEYGARAGTVTPFWTGATISTAQANYDGNDTYDAGTKGIYRARTVAMDDPSFPANPFGLFHVHGNVWEWVQDCHLGSYEGAPTDGEAAADRNDCPARVLRGGSWIDGPKGLRSAVRAGEAPEARNNVLGFRVARMLTP